MNQREREWEIEGVSALIPCVHRRWQNFSLANPSSLCVLAYVSSTKCISLAMDYQSVIAGDTAKVLCYACVT